MLGHSIRRFTTSVVRRSHYEEGPGKKALGWLLEATAAGVWLKAELEVVVPEMKNLPFSVENKWALLVKMCLFFGSAFSVPFLVVRHQLLKQ
uniref:Cytochrome c oxidase subunit 7C, mitochondrial n=1 Tax=Macaca mulatta TaxID=9544 RepID=A0A1D5R5E2_MACMU